MTESTVYVAHTASASGETPANARVWSPPPAAPPGVSGALAGALVAFEAELDRAAVARVVALDDSDAALAAVLVATKQGVPAQVTAAAARPSSANGRLLAQLAETYTEPR